MPAGTKMSRHGTVDIEPVILGGHLRAC